MPNSQWTREKDQALAGMYAAGEVVSSIATQMGCSEQAVRNRASTLGLLRRRTKSQGAGSGNAAWILGNSLAAVMHIPQDGEFDDLIRRLSTIDA